MINALEKIIHKFESEQSKDIRSRVVRLVLIGSILTFATLSIVSSLGLLTTWKILEFRSEDLTESTADYIEDFAEEQAINHIQGVANIKSKQINQSLMNIANDVQFIADTMNVIISNPQNYNSKSLSDARYKLIYEKEPYIVYSKTLLDNGISEDIRKDIENASNITDCLISLCDFYDNNEASLFICSKNDYLICIDMLLEDKSAVKISEGFLDNVIVTQRPWYIKAKAEDKLIFTDLYLTSDGALGITCAKPYYKGNEFAGAAGVGLTLNTMSVMSTEMLSKNTHRSTDIDFILDNKGEIVVSTATEGKLIAGTTDFETDFPELTEEMKAGKAGISVLNIGGEEYYIAYAPIEITGWSFASLLKKENIISSVKMLKTDVSTQMNEFQFGLSKLLRLLFIIASAILLILLLILFRFGIKSSDKFVKPIQELTAGVKDIASGDFDKKLDIRTGDEIESLALCFNSMTDELKTYMTNLTKATAEKERIATELNVATNIQISMLPRDFDFNRDDFEIYATMNAAKEVGGDFYDFYLLDENHLVITMADVSGKGVPAALFMANSKTILKNFAMTMSSPDDFAAVMALANNQLCQGNDEMMFVTVFMGMLDLETGKFIYVNGGHNPPMVYHKATDKFEYMEVKQNIVLGMMDGMDFEQQEIQLESGDMLYLYTDGVTEAMDIDNNQYGEQRLSECLNGVDKSADLPTILQNVRDDLSKHVGEAAQSDDITMLGLRYHKI